MFAETATFSQYSACRHICGDYFSRAGPTEVAPAKLRKFYNSLVILGEEFNETGQNGD